ncbi:TetR family transcriptional regulator [Mycolicibacterium sp. XJ662]
MIDAALKRFTANGVAATSVADITADAGVTERTFYRYFTSKEEVLFAEYVDQIDWFRRALEVRPRGEPLTDSVRHASAAFPYDHRVVTEAAHLRNQLSDEQIDVHLQRVQGRLASEIQRHILTTTGSDELHAAVTAAMVAGAVFAAFRHWTRHGNADLAQLQQMTERALAIAENAKPQSAVSD